MTENTFLTRYDEHGPLRCIAYAEGYGNGAPQGQWPSVNAYREMAKDVGKAVTRLRRRSSSTGASRMSPYVLSTHGVSK